MTQYNTSGIVYDQIICEDMALPNATDLTATNTVTLNSWKQGNLRVAIYAGSTTTEIVDGKTITFTPLFGNTAAAGGCLVRALGSFVLTGGNVSLNDPGAVTTVDNPNPLTFLPGALIYEFYLPSRLIGTYDYMRLNIACNADEHEDLIEAYLIAD